MNEKPIYFSPKDVLKIIFNKLLGNLDFFDNKPHFNPSSLKQKANNGALWLKGRFVQNWIELLINLFTFFWHNFTVLPSEIAQANGGNDIDEAVITVPFHFNDKQRTATRLVGSNNSNCTWHFVFLCTIMLAKFPVRKPKWPPCI